MCSANLSFAESSDPPSFSIIQTITTCQSGLQWSLRFHGQKVFVYGLVFMCTWAVEDVNPTLTNVWLYYTDNHNEAICQWFSLVTSSLVKIASLVTQKSLFTATHAVFFIYIMCIAAGAEGISRNSRNSCITSSSMELDEFTNCSFHTYHAFLCPFTKNCRHALCGRNREHKRQITWSVKCCASSWIHRNHPIVILCPRAHLPKILQTPQQHELISTA